MLSDCNEFWGTAFPHCEAAKSHSPGFLTPGTKTSRLCALKGHRDNGITAPLQGACSGIKIPGVRNPGL